MKPRTDNHFLKVKPTQLFSEDTDTFSNVENLLKNLDANTDVDTMTKVLKAKMKPVVTQSHVVDPESEKIKRQFRERQRLYKQQEREDEARLAATKKRKIQPIKPIPPSTTTAQAKEESKV